MKSIPEYFISLEQAPRLTPSAGLETTVLTGLSGETMMMLRTAVQPGHSLPTHTHPEDLVGTVISGKAVLRIADEERIISPDDFYYIPADVPHSVLCLKSEPLVIVDVFYPVRNDLLQKVRAAQQGG